jgi:hypothetical protein
MILLLAAGSTAESVAVSKSLPQRKAAVLPQVGVIKHSFNEGECGCVLQLVADYKRRNGRLVFVNDIDDAAQMNLDGRDVPLKQLSSKGDRNFAERVGARFSETYTGGGYRVKVDYLTTKVCRMDDDQCETTWYSADITVSRHNRAVKVKTLGVCGC